MKKSYLLLAALMGGFAFAQHGAPVNNTKMMMNNEVVSHSSNSNQNRAAGDVIGSVMDFSTPADWTNDAANAQDWLIGTTTPNGPFTTGAEAIASTSGGNFALIQGDGFTGTAILEMTNSVDLSANTNVAFQFESYYRNFTGEAFFEISTDGSAWTTYQVHEFILLNEDSGNPALININISDAIAANPTTVWARFRYESTDDYFWMVDDVAFTEGYDDNLIVDQTFMSMGPQGLDYYMIPNNQISEVTFGAYVTNSGINDQNATKLGVAVTENGAPIYADSSAAIDVVAFARDSFSIVSPNGWTPAADKEYDVVYGVGPITDQDLLDNTDTLYNVMTGGNVFARDNGLLTGAVSFVGDAQQATVAGNIFDVMGDMSIGRIQVGISSNAPDDSKIIVRLTKWNGSEYVFVEESDEYTITAADKGSIVEVRLNSLVDLFAGDDIELLVAHDGSVPIWTAQVGFGAQLYSGGSPSAQNSVFVVRGVYDFVGLDENVTNVMVSAYPNPATDNVNITYSVSQESNVSVSVVSVTGKVVYSNNVGNVAAGKYNENINSSEFANGVYFYTLTVNGEETTKKLIISNK
jgi:hypothetical protein